MKTRIKFYISYLQAVIHWVDKNATARDNKYKTKINKHDTFVVICRKPSTTYIFCFLIENYCWTHTTHWSFSRTDEIAFWWRVTIPRTILHYADIQNNPIWTNRQGYFGKIYCCGTIVGDWAEQDTEHMRRGLRRKRGRLEPMSWRGCLVKRTEKWRMCRG